MFRLSTVSLANRSVVGLLTIILTVAGLISLGSLKQELLPSFEVPQASIVTTYPGASPEVVDAQVSSIIEDEARILKNLVNVTSTSRANVSVVRVEFDFGVSTAQVEEELNRVVDNVQDSLPADVEPRVISGSFDSVPIIVLSVASTTGDNEALSEILEDIAVPILSQVPGIQEITVAGGKKKQITLDLKPGVLAANGLSQTSITDALRANGFILPAGSITDTEGELQIEIGTNVNSVEDFENLPLVASATSFAQLPGGLTGATTTPRILTIGEVAEVTYDYEPVTSISRTNGLDSLGIQVTKTQEGNTVAISNDVESKIDELVEKLGGDVEITTVFDQGPFVEKQLENLSIEGSLGLTFAILIILIFLASIRSTLVTAISIPTSLLVTFIGLWVSGYSLNLFTLSALTIAVGRVVDDSIVVIENINRHLSYGEPKKRAIIDAVKEVAGAITSATITTVAVFLPVALVGGIVGELFRPFSFSFTIALLASLVVSLTIVPVLAYWFLKAPVSEEQSAKESAKTAAARMEKARKVEEEKEKRSWLQRGYIPVLTKTQAKPGLTLVAAGAILMFTFSLVPQLKTDFIGDFGGDTFVVRQELPAGSTFEQRDEASKIVEDLILEQEGVETVLATFGGRADGRVNFGGNTNATTIQVSVSKDADNVAIQAAVQAEFDSRDDIGETTLPQGGGGGFGGSSTIDIKLAATSDEALFAAVEKVRLGMLEVDGISDITSSLSEQQRTLKITVDRVAAARAGLTEIQVSGIVAATLRPGSIGDVNIDNEATPIFIVQENTPATLEEIRDIRIPTRSGVISLDSIAEIQEVQAPVAITSEKGDRVATVSLTPDSDDLGAVTRAVTEALDVVELPIRATANIGGVSADQAESFGQLGLALLAAVAIVYLVMVATFSSLVQPLILLISIPFAATGALGLLLITDTPLGVPALIGMLLLVGVVVTNAIVLIDLINQYRKQGKSIQQSIMDGSRQRLRPIVMTALATIFALSPLALGITGGGFISQPLAIVVIGGLVSSTVLTLVIVPVLYWLIEGRAERKLLKAKAKGKRKPKAKARKRLALKR
ncbi:MAG: efflux RND transporter permease subunit [Rhodoluna sp.]|nr:efflux RND transporter permease subunit [Rhodoluna sp.]